MNQFLKQKKLKKLNLNTTLATETPEESKLDNFALVLFNKIVSLQLNWIVDAEEMMINIMLVMMKVTS
jgi:hypothetical protein